MAIQTVSPAEQQGLHPLYRAALDAASRTWEPDWFRLKRSRDAFVCNIVCEFPVRPPAMRAGGAFNWPRHEAVVRWLPGRDRWQAQRLLWRILEARDGDEGWMGDQMFYVVYHGA